MRGYLVLLCALLVVARPVRGAAPGWILFDRVPDAEPRGVTALSPFAPSVTAAFFNPALPALASRRSIVLTSEQGTTGRLNTVMCGLPAASGIVFAGVSSFDAGGADYAWNEGGALVTRRGTLESDVLGIAGYSRAYGPVLAGATLKAAGSNVAGHTAQAVAFDCGAACFPYPGWEAGVAVLNAGLASSYVSRADALPLAVALHGACALQQGETRYAVCPQLTWDAVRNRLVAEAGVELRYGCLLAAAAVRTADPGPRWRAGFGLTAGAFDFFYSWTPHPDLGTVHRFSAGYRL